MTTTNSTNVASAPVSLRLRQDFTLPSQEGRRGRPRSRGRAYVRSMNNHTLLGFEATRAALAAHYGMKVSELARYGHEEIDGILWVFIVPSLHKDQGQFFDGVPGAFTD